MTKQRILILDNDESSLKLLPMFFRRSGYDVDAAVTAETALMLLQKRRPDLILMNIILPDANSFELCGYIKANWSIPIMVMGVAGKVSADQMETLRTRIDDFVTKPFYLQGLLQQVKAVLNRAKPAPV